MSQSHRTVSDGTMDPSEVHHMKRELGMELVSKMEQTCLKDKMLDNLEFYARRGVILPTKAHSPAFHAHFDFVFRARNHPCTIRINRRGSINTVNG